MRDAEPNRREVTCTRVSICALMPKLTSTSNNSPTCGPFVMWVLDSTGDFLEGKVCESADEGTFFFSHILGKRVWLRPGKKYLFGRFQRDGGTHSYCIEYHTQRLTSMSSTPCGKSQLHFSQAHDH